MYLRAASFAEALLLSLLDMPPGALFSVLVLGEMTL